MNLADVSSFDVARLAAAAAFGWGLVSVLWQSISQALAASFAAYLVRLGKSDDDTTPPGPAASA